MTSRKRTAFTLLLLCAYVLFPASSQAADPPVSSYGYKNANAPEQLSIFSFLVGKWHGKHTVESEDGQTTTYEWHWIGRYVLDGMAIADELHTKNLDGSPYLGISLRQFDPSSQSWTVDYINVSNSFIRNQVNSQTGAVTKENQTVTVISDGGDRLIQETYEVENTDRFTYQLSTSTDSGKSWSEPQMEMTLDRIE